MHPAITFSKSGIKPPPPGGVKTGLFFFCDKGTKKEGYPLFNPPDWCYDRYAKGILSQIFRQKG